ncbi:hypothetical protein [Schaalia sp. Marseille-Q2122]|uniref:hypothetical protein n=1 Tax=Schaalia sp. Marseille-Q2122 TaxID=2736604 RepID=UPI00158E1AB3|nr:hypothetical protein [Schaalia sp. Marseille-Q2122]
MSSDQIQELKALALAPLTEARFERPDCDDRAALQAASARELCRHADSVEGAEWAGIVYSTRGFFLVYGVSGNSVKSTERASDDLLDTAYELRLWRVNLNSNTDNVLAHELRWVNGGGAVDLRVVKAVESDKTGCWYRENQYLQHGQEIDGPTMTSLEVFTEDTYGNVVFADELMTGKWA